MLGPNENEIKPEPTSINEIQGDPGPCHQEGENIKTFVDYFIWGGDIDSKYLFSCNTYFHVCWDLGNLIRNRMTWLPPRLTKGNIAYGVERPHMNLHLFLISTPMNKL